MLLRAYQTPPSPTSVEASAATVSGLRETPVDLTPFLRLSADLLLLFHTYWIRGDCTVMREFWL